MLHGRGLSFGAGQIQNASDEALEPRTGTDVEQLSVDRKPHLLAVFMHLSGQLRDTLRNHTDEVLLGFFKVLGRNLVVNNLVSLVLQGPSGDLNGSLDSWTNGQERNLSENTNFDFGGVVKDIIVHFLVERARRSKAVVVILVCVSLDLEELGTVIHTLGKRAHDSRKMAMHWVKPDSPSWKASKVSEPPVGRLEANETTERGWNPDTTS